MEDDDDEDDVALYEIYMNVLYEDGPGPTGF